jgi:geranylgeranyl pyrophosphate synthase
LLSSQSISDSRICCEAATAIQLVGDSSALEEVEQWLSKESDGACRQRLRETISTLRASNSDKKVINALKEEIDEVKEQVSELDRQVAKIHA